MVGTIRPVVYRNHHMRNWLIALLFHLLGSTLAAIIVGGLFGMVGQWIGPQIGERGLRIAMVVAPVSLLYSLAELGFIRLPHPQRNRQVPEIWRRKFHPHLVALLYGLELGTGLSTRIVTRTLYVVILGVVAAGNMAFAALAFGFFGLGRGLPVGIIGWRLRSAYTGEQVHPVLERVMAQKERVHLLNAYVLALVGGFCLTGLLSFVR